MKASKCRNIFGDLILKTVTLGVDHLIFEGGGSFQKKLLAKPLQ